MMSHSPPLDLADYEAALERRAGGNLSADEVASLLGITFQAVDERRRAQSLLAIRRGDGWIYPRAQFHGNGTVPCLAAVVEGLDASGPWVTLEFIITPDGVLDGLSPREALLSGGDMLDRVMTVVCGHREGEGFT
ncbi:hypothetical protein [Belnapia rosea]|uniref:hypothetical protein n=1 Tax=Belnapia rosea TaxID=938405 RepID=UPI0008860BF7|nr:hypothetical protein [Belnapia rosea]SDB74525.1 hypothetical protein SAMN02927895_05252 [Belnapia rosea]